MHRIKLIQEKKVIDITDISGNVTLSNSVDSLGSSFNFDIARNFNDPNFATSETVKNGDFVKFIGEIEMFFGIIIDIDTNKFKKSIKCLDFSFYLNKNKVIKQFKNIGASTAITQLCRDVGVPIGIVEEIKTSITKIYKNNTVAEIINDILKQAADETGNKYRLEINGGKLDLQKYKNIGVKSAYDFIGMTNKLESIVNMKNKILVTSNNQDETNILSSAVDEKSIKKYGMLQDILQVDPKDISKVRNIAKKKLEELNKIFTTSSIEVIGNDFLRSGRVFKVINKEFGLNGQYLIKNCTHSFPKGNHTARLELEVI